MTSGVSRFDVLAYLGEQGNELANGNKDTHQPHKGLK